MTLHHVPALVKLQRVPNRTRGDKTYYKWQVTLPPDAIIEMGWQEGDDLDAKPSKAGLLVTRTADAPLTNEPQS